MHWGECIVILFLKIVEKYQNSSPVESTGEPVGVLNIKKLDMRSQIDFICLAQNNFYLNNFI